MSIRAGSRAWTWKACRTKACIFGADPVLKSWNPGALREPRPDLLAGRDAGSAPIDLTVRTRCAVPRPVKEATAPADQRRIEQANGRPAPELRRDCNGAGIRQP